MQKRIQAAQGNPELLAQLRKEAEAVRCELPDLAAMPSSTTDESAPTVH